MSEVPESSLLSSMNYVVDASKPALGCSIPNLVPFYYTFDFSQTCHST